MWAQSSSRKPAAPGAAMPSVQSAAVGVPAATRLKQLAQRRRPKSDLGLRRRRSDKEQPQPLAQAGNLLIEDLTGSTSNVQHRACSKPSAPSDFPRRNSWRVPAVADVRHMFSKRLRPRSVGPAMISKFKPRTETKIRRPAPVSLVMSRPGDVQSPEGQEQAQIIEGFAKPSERRRSAVSAAHARPSDSAGVVGTGLCATVSTTREKVTTIAVPGGTQHPTPSHASKAAHRPRPSRQPTTAPNSDTVSLRSEQRSRSSSQSKQLGEKEAVVQLSYFDIKGDSSNDSPPCAQSRTDKAPRDVSPSISAFLRESQEPDEFRMSISQMRAIDVSQSRRFFDGQLPKHSQREAAALVVKTALGSGRPRSVGNPQTSPACSPVPHRPGAWSVPSGRSFVEDDIPIPTLPCGRKLLFNLVSTWGDQDFAGLAGIEIFDANGCPIRIEDPEKQTVSSTSTHPETGARDTAAAKLFDSSPHTCDDAHMWLLPFRVGATHTLEVDLLEPRQIAMIRVWNYNRSKIHSARGVRQMEILLEGKRPIFNGEIRQATGNLSAPDANCEHILFSVDDSTLEAIASNDWLSDLLDEQCKEDESPHSRALQEEQTVTESEAAASLRGSLRDLSLSDLLSSPVRDGAAGGQTDRHMEAKRDSARNAFEGWKPQFVPKGAVLTSIDLYFLDSHSEHDIYCGLQRLELELDDGTTESSTATMHITADPTMESVGTTDARSSPANLLCAAQPPQPWLAPRQAEILRRNAQQPANGATSAIPILDQCNKLSVTRIQAAISQQVVGVKLLNYCAQGKFERGIRTGVMFVTTPLHNDPIFVRRFELAPAKFSEVNLNEFHSIRLREM